MEGFKGRFTLRDDLDVGFRLKGRYDSIPVEGMIVGNGHTNSIIHLMLSW
jgi:hypothetical protein